MAIQISPLFQAVEEKARRYPTPKNVLRGAEICYRAKEHADEIQLFRHNRQLQRDNCLQEGSRNGHLMTGEIHPVEYEACVFLCSLLKEARAGAKKSAWQWILKQDWGQEFSASPIEKRRFMH